MRPFGWILLLAFTVPGALAPRAAAADASLPPPSATAEGLADAFLGRSWEIDDGYPDVTATCFAQTGDGYLWVGTFSQLLRFDGRTFVEITPPEVPALGRSMVLDLTVDANGALWVATSRGVGRLAEGQWTWFGPDQGVPNGTVRDVVPDHTGTLYAARGNLLLRFDHDRFVPVELPRPSVRDGDPLRILTDGNGVLWAVDHAWLARLEPTGWNVIEESDPTDPNTPFTGLARSGDGGMWVGHQEILNKWRDGTWREAVRRPPGQAEGAVFLLEDRRQGLWGGCYVSGLFRIGPTGETLTGAREVGLRNPSILSLFEDAEGNIWVGTNGGGITRLRPRSIHTSAEDDELAQTIINSFVPYDGGFLVATHGGGVRQWRDGHYGPPFWVSGPTRSSWPQTLLADPDGRCWVGTFADGLHSARPGDERGLVRLPDEAVPGRNVRAMLRDQSGALWVGTEVGLSMQDPSGQWRQWSDGTNPDRAGVYMLAKDETGPVWLVTQGGVLWRWPVDASAPQRMDDPVTGDPVRVGALIPAHDAGVWVTTRAGDVGRWRDGTWQPLTHPTELPEGGWNVLLDDGQGSLWLAGGEGLMQLALTVPTPSPDDAPAPVRPFRLFTQADGMPASGIRFDFHPSVYPAADGRIWFSTYKGLAVIDPAHLAVSQFTPAPIIESVVVGTKVYPVDPSHPEVVLPPHTRRATVNYTGVSLGTPDLVRFAVRIDDIDAAWEEVGTLRHAQLLDFKPGRYVVRVQAWQEDLLEHRAPPTSLVVVFLPAWWQTWWFRLLSGLTIVGLSGLGLRAYFRARDRQMNERTAHLEALAKERQEAHEAREASEISAAASRAKSDFLATMSHEIRTPLNGVIGSAELLATTELNGEQQDHLRTLQSSAESLLSLLNDVLDFAKIEAGKVELNRVPFDLPQLAREVCEVVVPQTIAKGLEFGLVLDPAVPTTVLGDAGRLRQILLNLLSNATKFTARGEVVLRIRRINAVASGDGPDLPRLRFEVSDTGIGIAPAALARVMERFTQADSSTTRRFGGTGLGLTICRSLLELMNSRLEVTSQVDQGTTFAFAVELPQAPTATAAVGSSAFTHAVVLERTALGAETVVAALQRLGIQTVATLDPGLVQSRLDPLPPATTVLLVHQDLVADASTWPRHGTLLLAEPGQPIGTALTLRKPLLNGNELRRALALLRSTAEGASPLPANAVPSASSGPWQTPPSGAPAPLILLAEDDPTSRRIGSQLLKRLGCTFDMVADGRQAVACFAPGKYDLVLMDCHMPELDGYSATEQMRALEQARPELPRTPIIALTANVIAEDRARCFAVGMDDFLAKPVRLPGLGSTLARWLPVPPNGPTPPSTSGPASDNRD